MTNEQLKEGHEHAISFCKSLELEHIPCALHIRHQEIHSCEESNEIYERYDYLLDKPIINCRHLVLQEKEGDRIFLFIMDASKGKTDLKEISYMMGSERLTFATDEVLSNLLHTYSGNVSLFNLLYDKSNQIEVVLDSSLQEDAYYAFHPLFNADSVFLSSSSIKQFLNKIHHSYDILDIPVKENEKVLKLAM